MPKVKFQFYLGQYILLQLSVLKGPCLDFVNHQDQTAELTNDKRQNDKRQLIQNVSRARPWPNYSKLLICKSFVTHYYFYITFKCVR